MTNICSQKQFFFKTTFAFLFLLFPIASDAATLRLSPETGIYTSGGTFTANVLINTDGKSVNAADGQLSFNPKELTVVSASRSSSIFNLWTLEPTFSNSAGTISFGGGSPSGYKGSNGTVMSITFRAGGAGTPKVVFKSGSILAADGLGTNILTTMTGGTYTISAQTDTPAAEYIPPANTPKAPVVTSSTHPDTTLWYKEISAELSWVIPTGVTSVRMLLDQSKETIPTITYDEPITKKSIKDLPQGESYFHIQFKNADGWGRVTHFPLRVDSEAPSRFEITDENADVTNPVRTLTFIIEDVSPITKYLLQLDGGTPSEYIDIKNAKQYELQDLMPGHHTVIVEAFDSAGNSRIATHSFTIDSFEPPTFIDYPTRINTEVIPAIKGKTRPGARIAVEVRRASDGSFIQKVEGDEGKDPYTIVSDGDGMFTYVPDAAFERGVYTITAMARDEFGRFSEKSNEIRIIVEAPGYVVIGTLVVNALSVIIPLVALSIVLIFGTWYLLYRLRRWKRRVMRETLEAEDKLRIELDALVDNMHARVNDLKESRKNKLTIAEAALIEQIEHDVASAREKIKKEIIDIERIVE